MAYLAFAEGSSVAGQPARALAPAPALHLVPDAPSLSALEWLVVAIAKRDPLSSLRQPGRLSTAMGVLFGTRQNPRLADDRLEALRRIAVLSWHYGYVVPTSEVNRFVEAGFTTEQYELLVDSIGADQLAQRNERFRR
jgi:hypothetical protein